MNRNLFLQMLAYPDSVSEAENIALKKFTEDFPYCQTGQLLFVKHLHSQSSVHFPDQLKVAAAYAADRKVLYHLVHNAPPLTPLQDKEERVEESLVQTSVELIKEKKIVEEGSNKQDIIQKRLQELASSRKTEIVPEKKEEKKTVVQPEPEIVLQKTEAPPLKVIPEKTDSDITKAQHSFTDWLKTVKKEAAIEPKTEEKRIKPATSTEEIITRFIETEPRIVPSKAQFYNPIKMAKQSLEEHDDLVSETLAGIFAQQGNLPKAIEMYRKLLLIYPEKNAFFAALIEKLTHQLNTEK